MTRLRRSEQWRRKRWVTVSAFLACTSTPAQQLPNSVRDSILARLCNQASRMDAAHLVAEISYPTHPNRARAEFWSSSDSLHVQAEYPVSEYFFDRFGYYIRTPNRNLLVYKPFERYRADWLCRILGSDPRLLHKVTISLDNGDYLLTGAIHFVPLGEDGPSIAVKERFGPDLKLKEIEYSRTTNLDDSLALGKSIPPPNSTISLRWRRGRHVPTEKVVVKSYGYANGIAYPNSVDYYLDHVKSMSRNLTEASFLKPSIDKLKPDFFSPDVVICDFRNRAQVFWEPAQLLEANHGAKAEPETLFKLSAMKSEPIARSRHQSLMIKRFELVREKAEESPKLESIKQSALQFLGAFVLIAAFIASAIKTLRHRPTQDLF